MSEKLVPLNVLITPNQKAALEDSAKQEGISTSLFVRRILLKTLTKEQNYRILGHYKTRRRT